VFFVFILPIGIVLLIGAQFSGDFSPRLGVASGGGTIAASIVDTLKAEDRVNVVEYDSSDALDLAVQRGEVSAGLEIPAGVDAAVAEGSGAEVAFVSRPDGFGPQLQSVVSEAVSSAILEPAAVRYAVSKGADPALAAGAVGSAVAAVPAIEVTSSTLGTSLFEGVSGRFDIGASSQLILFMFLTGLTGSAALIQSRQLGVTRRMAGTPTSVGTIIAGEALGRFVIVLVQGLYIMGATILLFRVDWGDPIGAAAVLLMFSAVGAGAAMLVGTIFRNDQQAGGIGIVAGIGLAALGGAMLPAELFSPAMKVVARFTPHSWALDAFAQLVRHGASVFDITRQLAMLAAFAVVFLAIATWRMRRVITRA
jgi:ABC-2 type transport system permease protein